MPPASKTRRKVEWLGGPADYNATLNASVKDNLMLKASADIVFICSDRVRVYAHQLILSNVSDLLRNTFRTRTCCKCFGLHCDNRNKDPQTIYVEFNGNVVYMLVYLLYTGETNITRGAHNTELMNLLNSLGIDLNFNLHDPDDESSAVIRENLRTRDLQDLAKNKPSPKKVPPLVILSPGLNKITTAPPSAMNRKPVTKYTIQMLNIEMAKALRSEPILCCKVEGCTVTVDKSTLASHIRHHMDQVSANAARAPLGKGPPASVNHSSNKQAPQQARNPIPLTPVSIPAPAQPITATASPRTSSEAMTEATTSPCKSVPAVTAAPRTADPPTSLRLRLLQDMSDSEPENYDDSADITSPSSSPATGRGVGPSAPSPPASRVIPVFSPENQLDSPSSCSVTPNKSPPASLAQQISSESSSSCDDESDKEPEPEPEPIPEPRLPPIKITLPKKTASAGIPKGKRTRPRSKSGDASPYKKQKATEDDDAKPQEKPPNKSTVDEVKVPAAKEKWTLVKSSNKSPKIQTAPGEVKPSAEVKNTSKTTKSPMSTHRLCVPTATRKYACLICTKGFLEFRKLKTHYTLDHFWKELSQDLKHMGNKCDICMLSYPTDDHLVQHFGNFHNWVDKYLTAKNLYILNEERTVHVQNKQCPICQLPVFGARLKAHMSMVHFKDKILTEFKVTARRCPKCNKAFETNTSAIAAHIGCFHDEVLKYANPLLVMAEEDAELIPVDDFDDGVVGEPYQELLNPDDKKLISCQKCLLRFSRLDLKMHYLRAHLQTEFNAVYTKLKCIVCDLEFGSLSKVHEHIVLNHESLLEEFLIKENLSLPPKKNMKKKREKKQDPHELPFSFLTCQICYTNIESASDLKVHYITHLNPDFPSNFFSKRCNFCEMTFSSIEENHKHMAISHTAQSIVPAMRHRGLWVNDPLPGDIGSPPMKRVAVGVQKMPTVEVNGLLGIQQSFVCPLPGCSSEEESQEKFLLHLLHTHYKRQMEEKYKAEYAKNRKKCSICNKVISEYGSLLVYLQHMAVEHHAVLAFVQADVGTMAGPRNTVPISYTGVSGKVSKSARKSGGGGLAPRTHMPLPSPYALSSAVRRTATLDDSSSTNSSSSPARRSRLSKPKKVVPPVTGTTATNTGITTTSAGITTTNTGITTTSTGITTTNTGITTINKGITTTNTGITTTNTDITTTNTDITTTNTYKLTTLLHGRVRTVAVKSTGGTLGKILVRTPGKINRALEADQLAKLASASNGREMAAPAVQSNSSSDASASSNPSKFRVPTMTDLDELSRITRALNSDSDEDSD